MLKILMAMAVLALLGVWLGYLVSPLHTFNTLVPKDGGGRRVASDLAYGENPRQQLDIYAPAAVGQDQPVIVFFYGGSWNSGTRAGYDFVGRALAAQGFVVVLPDYRLVPEVRYPGFVADAASAVRWVRGHVAEYSGDPERIVLAGHSAGAYNAAMLAFDDRWLGADRDAVRGFVGLAGAYDFLPLDTDSTRAAFGHWHDLSETQPVAFASSDDPPALLLHGVDDTTVRPRNSTALAAALSEAGVAAQVIEYPATDHIDVLIRLSRPLRAQTPVLADMASFAHRVTSSR
jgi:acetyl esterase/lipase